MLNLVKISCQIKMFSIQAHTFDRLVCMPAICYSGPISAVLANVQIFGEKRSGAKFQSDILKTERVVPIYTDRRTDTAKSA